MKLSRNFIDLRVIRKCGEKYKQKVTFIFEKEFIGCTNGFAARILFCKGIFFYKKIIKERTGYSF